MTDDYACNPKLTDMLISCLKEWGIQSLTDIQERAIAADVALGSSAIVCAPTSSGKTLIGELALANALNDGFDALYLVSHKALAEQKFADFADRFSTARWTSTVTVGISTGDHEEGDANCRLLVSTYEKALGLLLAGRLKVAKTVIIADELQPRRSGPRPDILSRVVELYGVRGLCRVEDPTYAIPGGLWRPSRVL